MRIAVCDDEKIFANELKGYLDGYYKSLDVAVETFSSGEEFLEGYMKNPNAFELVFMDIEMNGLDGIGTARRLRELNREVTVIFVTSHTELAAEGYEVDAFRFLTKPVSEKKMAATLQDAQRELDREKRIIVRDGGREILLRHSDLIYIESQNVNLFIMTKDSSYTTRGTLEQMWREIESPKFYRPHRSYIVNIGRVKGHDGRTITMETGDVIPVSRGRVSGFREAMRRYVKS